MVNSSGSEDGQLRSPNDGHYHSRGEDDEHEADADALYIQPPQASRELGSGSRREKKKHSRERRRHKDREDVGAGGGLGPDRDHRYEYRNREEHYHHHHRERGGNVAAAYPKHHLGHAYHYPQPPQQQQQPLPPAPSYAAHHHHHHQHLGGARAAPRGDYHSYPSGYHSSSRHGDYPMEEPPRRGSKYAESKDAESLEQDLRSRLLKKRHNYVKDYETEENYEHRGERSERRESGRKERERSGRSSHKQNRHDRVIELLDSPEPEHQHQHQHQHKSHRSKWREEVEVNRRKVPEDLELLARREKLLAAERDSRQRKQTAREELEARRELLRERNEHSDALSPTTVAASVTAGLNIQVKRKSKPDNYEKEIKHKKRREEVVEVIRDDEDEDEESEQSDSNEEDPEEDSAESGTESGSDESYASKKKSKIKAKPQLDDDDDEDLPLPDSPLSVGELYKSPKQRQRSRSVSSKSSSQSSRSSRSRSRSRSQSSLEDAEDRQDAGTAASPSSSTRSEERGMSQQEQEEKPEDKLKDKALKLPEEQTPCDDKGVPLPNYYPGVQGCRSVEEFQCLNRIEEGTYGVVYRAKDKRTNEIVALKRLKMEKEKEGFPITSLREINTLLKGQHPNIVTVREIVVGSNMDKIFIVMDYVEHDLKSLMETMKNRKQSFFPGEVKCLTQQLLLAVAHLHDNWILHRDLKTSNLLLSHKGILKVGDFGLAREYGSPIKKYTSLVVTLWYRAPELLLCSPVYSTPIDVWSVGCIFAEFLQMLPLFPGKSEIDELNRIFKELGTPNEKIWPGYTELPAVKNMLSQNSQFTEYPVSQLRKHFQEKTSDMGLSLLQGLLTFDPKQRLTADAALKHGYFKELPLPIDPSMFPTWPAKSELGARKAQASSPKPPSGGSQFKQLGRDEPIAAVGPGNKLSSGIITGNKKSHGAGGSSASTGFVLNSGLTQRQLAMGPGFSLKF
ncbi:serine/threonine-protein kinase PITSLRE isoform X1 [Drosophila elegans]|uniref:serine/threonine-protein kinase PITSLRE isoform X1 n=2 Tax=Drosophila elegans TaxID=30023 RepID=UPI0007E5FE15|nr:serine/threonine-protein kinase PITSLRE isoform X1 [Drosophila elegans]